MPVSPILPILLGCAASLGCLAGAFVILRKKRTIDDLPTSKTQGVFIGMAEVKGTAESENPLVSYLAGINCVQYHWHVDEHWQRTVTSTTMVNGKAQTTTRTESGWKQIASGGNTQPFYLKDDTGNIRILPEGANIHNDTVFNQTVRPNAPLYYSKAPAGAVPNSTFQRRFTEHALPLHAMLYILGQARERADVVAAEIAKDKAAPMYLISTQTEKQISSGYAIGYWVLFILGMLASLGGALGWQIVAGTNWLPWLIMGIGYLLFWLIIYIWTTYNNLINLHHRVEQGWSQVDVQLKRRFDLIPNLVQAVKGYQQYEADTQTLLAEMRKQSEATPPGVTGPDFMGLAPLISVILEKYPEIKANQNFLKLQQSLIDTEQRTALARDYYNQIVTFYNTRLEIIPQRYVAALASLKKGSLMGAADFERAVVKVNLAE
jgi:hypothetical protein